MYKLLIVDDEKMIRMGIKNGIEWAELGIEEVYTAASAKEALSVVEKEHPQIMLTDISMAEMSGLALMEKIREQYGEKEMRILVLTGYDKFEYARQCLQMRVQNFLLKPIDEEELKASVQEQIDILEEIRMKQEQEHASLRTEGSKRQAAMEHFMRDLVHQRLGEGISEYPEELAADRKKSMEIAILIPEVYMGKGKEQDLDFRQLTIKNICMDLIDARRAGITFLDDDGKIVLAIYTSDTERNVTEWLEELSEILENECDIKPRVVLGSEAEGLDTLFVSYNDASFLLEQERKGFREIVRSGSEQTKEQLIQDIYREFKQTMTANIANGNRVMHIFENFGQATKSYNLSRAQVQKWCFDMASSMYFTCITETGELVDNRMESLLKMLVSADKEEALEMTEMFIRKLVFREEEEQHEIITSARRYIDENLGSDLSVAKLAEQFYVSPNYFSRLFKKVMNEGCNEYIVKKRIEKSRILLETTTIKAGKIAMMVGYNDTNYFSLAFKKHTGMSPTKYRETLQGRQE